MNWGLHFGRCKEYAKVILAGKGVTSPTQEQLAKAMDAHFYVNV